jgi:tetratricopeptide (TPR) repeat protein
MLAGEHVSKHASEFRYEFTPQITKTITRNNALEKIKSYTAELVRCVNDLQKSDIYSLCAVACARLADHSKVIEYTTLALDNLADQTEKHCGMVFSMRAMAYFALNNFEKAVTDYTNALQLDLETVDNKKISSLFLRRSMAHSRLLNFKSAIDDMVMAMKFSPNLSTLQWAVKNIFSQHLYLTLEYILRPECPEDLRCIIQDMMTKPISHLAFSTDMLDLALIDDIYKFYLPLSLSREKYFPDNCDFEMVMIRQSSIQKTNPEVMKWRAAERINYEVITNQKEIIQLSEELWRCDNEADKFKIYHNLGVAYQKTNNVRESLQNYWLSINELSEDRIEILDAYFHRGLALLNFERYDEAILDFSEAIRLSSRFVLSGNFAKNNLKAIIFRSHAFMRNGNFDLAMKDIVSVAELKLPKEFFQYTVQSLFSAFPFQTAEYILRQDCPESVREPVREKLIKTATAYGKSTQAEVCSFYLNMSLEREKFFDANSTLGAVIKREANSRKLSSRATNAILLQLSRSETKPEEEKPSMPQSSQAAIFRQLRALPQLEPAEEVVDSDSDQENFYPNDVTVEMLSESDESSYEADDETREDRRRSTGPFPYYHHQ